jgi:hypothetical protein
MHQYGTVSLISGLGCERQSRRRLTSKSMPSIRRAMIRQYLPSGATRM